MVVLTVGLSINIYPTFQSKGTSTQFYTPISVLHPGVDSVQLISTVRTESQNTKRISSSIRWTGYLAITSCFWGKVSFWACSLSVLRSWKLNFSSLAAAHPVAPTSWLFASAIVAGGVVVVWIRISAPRFSQDFLTGKIWKWLMSSHRLTHKGPA